jgi:sterol desaturase/sphingolipid hydroxylase (fatty acid hydroxylase superfamily)
MAQSVAAALVGLLLFSGFFYLLERAAGGFRGPFFRRGWRTDAIYWFLTPMVTRVVSRTLVLLPFLLLIALGVATVEGLRAREYAGFGPLSRQPIWLQAIEVLLMADLIGYWIHRKFHRGRWWPFHAVHHSSEDLDWLSSVRVHPVNSLVANLLQATPLVLLGFNPFTTLSVGPFLTFYAVLLHARVDWTYGPLGSVIASPAFHRWHHSKDGAAIDRNFAGLFAFWDVLWGTFYLPNDRRPENFGITDAMPSGVVGQFRYPFRRPPAETAGAGVPRGGPGGAQSAGEKQD